jgi:RHS repeat-associated protein
MRAWSVLRQLLAATLCAVLVAPAYPSESTLPQRSSTPSHTYDAATLSKTRVWGSNEKILLHFRAVPLVSGKQHWGSAKCSCKNVVGSVVTYDYDAYGNLIHSTGTTPNNCLFAGEQFDPDLGLYYNRARYLNTSTGRFWSMDSFLTIQRHCTNVCTRITTRLREAILLVISARRPV